MSIVGRYKCIKCLLKCFRMNGEMPKMNSSLHYENIPNVLLDFI
uniref:Macaca fascicularis brain cDNA clone: QtrA-17296, similar to human stress 70 protein chaperone, microsome-associated, 60kDa(STCH), mRNA, RefSeq: NM_006948.3 n=1 Tax=Macaca fascicularis TaxID=9541 RepID=I7GJE2_MACFA|nr:unnamed protein product [Macaca fascicularis]